MKKLLLIAALFVSGSMIANAQNVGTATATQPINIVIKNVFDMNLSTTSTRSFSFDALTDYDNGMEMLNANTINYKTNKAWKVNVKALTSDFTGGAGTTAMPASVIKVRKNGDAGYVAISSTDQELATGSRGSSNFNIDYKATPGYSYEAGTYAVTLQYTITNQ
jgi:hypothetical protein